MNMPSRQERSPIFTKLHFPLRFGFSLLLSATVTGAASAVFLLGLAEVTGTRQAHSILFLFCPLAGLLTGWIYSRKARSCARGNQLVVELIRAQAAPASGQAQASLLKRVPLPLAPLIALATWLSHLVGASVGREGTAVQMGAGVAATTGRLLTLPDSEAQRILLLCGVAAGFGSVFGVPLTGAVFALELGQWRRLSPLRRSEKRDHFSGLTTFIACFLSSVVADQVCRLLGAEHIHYPQWSWQVFRSANSAGSLSLAGAAGHVLLTVLGCGVLFGVTAWIFMQLSRLFRDFLQRWVRSEVCRPALGGAAFAIFYFLPGLQRYAGLGTEVIAQSFTQALPWRDAAAKLFFTVIAIGSGFRGGEVTPLFFIGTSLGSAFSEYFHLPPQAIASLGLTAVFGAAAGTPLACGVLAAELMGWELLPLSLAVCLASALFCRKSRLYDEI
jgi:H+/Cl- antiporter ClcA